MKTPTVVFFDEVSIYPMGTFINMLRVLNRFDQLEPEVKAKLEGMALAKQPIMFCNNNIA